MDLLVVKLVVTPLLIAGVTLAGRRWGPSASGWLSGLPLTSAPISTYLALEHGTGFAAAAAEGIFPGLIAGAAFYVAYAHASRRLRWPAALAVALVVLVACAAALQGLRLGLGAWVMLAVLAHLVGLLLTPRVSGPTPLARPAWWDLPARMVVATGMVLLVTYAARDLGPFLSGLVSPFPAFVITLLVFVHQQLGSNAAIRLLRGVLISSFAFIAFFVAVALGLPIWGLLGGYAAACAAAMAVQGVLAIAVRRR